MLCSPGFEMELVPSYSPMFALVNTKFTLTCKVKDLPEKATIEMESNYGDPKLQNFYVKEKTDVVGKTQVTSKTITKDSVEVSDTGSYWCQANAKEKSVNLVVIRGEILPVHYLTLAGGSYRMIDFVWTCML